MQPGLILTSLAGNFYLELQDVRPSILDLLHVEQLCLTKLKSDYDEHRLRDSPEARLWGMRVSLASSKWSFIFSFSIPHKIYVHGKDRIEEDN